MIVFISLLFTVTTTAVFAQDSRTKPIDIGKKDSLDFDSSKKISPITVTHQGLPKTFADYGIQINLYLPMDSGSLKIEVQNNASYMIGLIEFDLHVLGGQGKIRFRSLPVTNKMETTIAIPSTKELTIRNLRVVDHNASEQYPKTIIQVIQPKPPRPQSNPTGE